MVGKLFSLETCEAGELDKAEPEVTELCQQRGPGRIHFLPYPPSKKAPSRLSPDREM